MGTASHKAACARLVIFVIFYIRALLTDVKITNDGLTRSGTGCFKLTVPIIWQQWA